jgi:starvation-inducible DNA-binding protein
MAKMKTAGTLRVDAAAVGTELQDTLVELVDLSLRGKQAHWNIVGSHFRSLHLQLDEVIDAVRLAADDVAERAVAVGYSPDGRPGTVSASGLAEFPAGQVSVSEVIDLFTDVLEMVCANIRTRIERLEELDLVSQDLLIGHLATLEKYHWMFAVQQAKNG